MFKNKLKRKTKIINYSKKKIINYNTSTNRKLVIKKKKIYKKLHIFAKKTNTKTYKLKANHNKIFFNKTKIKKKKISYHILDNKYLSYKRKYRKFFFIFKHIKRYRRFKHFISPNKQLLKFFLKKMIIHKKKVNKHQLIKTSPIINKFKKIFLKRFLKLKFYKKRLKLRKRRDKHLKRKIRYLKRKKKYFKTKKKLKQKLSTQLYINLLNKKVKTIKKRKKLYYNHYITNRSLKSFLLDSFSKKKKYNYIQRKNKKRKTFVFNFWKKKLTVFKKARNIHWNNYLSHKTLKKRRYKNFFPKFLNYKNYKNTFSLAFLSFKFKFSKLFLKNYTTLYYNFFNKKTNIKEIYQLPISFMFWNYLKILKKKKLKLNYKIKKWIKKKKRTRRKFWMRTKKNLPSFFYKQIISYQNIFNNFQFDFLTNYFCFFKKLNNIKNENEIFYYNKLIKNHDFRYKS